MGDTNERLHEIVDQVDPGEQPPEGGPGARAAHTGRSVFARASRWYLRTHEEYEKDGAGDDERPLTGYALLSTGYVVATTTAAALVARRRGSMATRPGPADLALLSVAVFRTTRTMSKSAVLSHLRSPFTVFAGPAGPAEVMERPRPGPVRHAAGELVTCPFCLGQWVSTAAVISFAAAPEATRWAATVMAVVAASDVLQFGYSTLEKAAE